jgi:hypothetical protein
MVFLVAKPVPCLSGGINIPYPQNKIGKYSKSLKLIFGQKPKISLKIPKMTMQYSISQ